VFGQSGRFVADRERLLAQGGFAAIEFGAFFGEPSGYAIPRRPNAR
jgi:hypothetical protein